MHDPARTARDLEAWFRRHGRDLPWRRTHDPYRVLLAEFILQQTRMETGLRYFDKFVRRFPDLASLARARPETVLALWSGLGYYRRARNLHACARRIMTEHGGRIPKDALVLDALPGIGPYTAGAIASIAYNRPEPSLDGNQLRVLGRFLGMSDPETRAGRRRLDAWARELLLQGSPRILNQALMDLGSSICLPETPRCNVCPLADGCTGRISTRRPNRNPARKTPVEAWTAFRYTSGGRVWLMAPRGAGVLGEHWLPPLQPGRSSRKPDLVHAFSHKTWHVIWTRGRGEPPGPGRWVRRSELARLPHGPLTRRFLEAALSGGARGPGSRRVSRGHL